MNEWMRGHCYGWFEDEQLFIRNLICTRFVLANFNLSYNVRFWEHKTLVLQNEV
jgi:hypothetical protein